MLKTVITIIMKIWGVLAVSGFLMCCKYEFLDKVKSFRVLFEVKIKSRRAHANPSEIESNYMQFKYEVSWNCLEINDHGTFITILNEHWS